jgi:glyoxylase-like metal-dependent hydrolase (beta-lactamase superfamily II)
MMKLHVVQALFGDSLLLEFGTSQARRFILIDGGPPFTFKQALHESLKTLIPSPRVLDAVVLSHVDNDHIVGLLDLVAELRRQQADGEPATLEIRELWHNSFSRAIDQDGTLQARLRSLLSVPGAAQEMTLAGEAVAGIGEGNSLRLAALAMTPPIPLNPDFPDDLILVDTAGDPRSFGDMTFRVVGPTQENLDALAAEWKEWLDTHEDAVGSGDPFVMANADQSIPNLSSIMALAEADGKSILLTGDGRSDHLLTGLRKTGLLPPAGGKLHVNVLKLPHHGSNRNITKTFFKTVTADTYVASANGKNDNPDLATLIWLVEAARAQDRRVELVVTNRTLSIEKLLEEYPQDEFGYTLRVLPKGERFITVTVAT